MFSKDLSISYISEALKEKKMGKGDWPGWNLFGRLLTNKNKVVKPREDLEIPAPLNKRKNWKIMF